jgi:solute carrier family 31 (copper transporter), member 1
MLWNWYTIDACFIARSWHVRSSGAFAGSCIGVILLVIALELLRRSQREFDRYLRLPHARNGSETGSGNDAPRTAKNSQIKVAGLGLSSWAATTNTRALKLWQHAVRSLLYTVQFAVGYFIMLLAMYYNGESYIQITFYGRSLNDGPWALLPGYIIICILIGAFLGAMIFQWDTFDKPL